MKLWKVQSTMEIEDIVIKQNSEPNDSYQVCFAILWFPLLL